MASQMFTIAAAPAIVRVMGRIIFPLHDWMLLMYRSHGKGPAP
jgi:hypothetical protein